MLMVLPQNDQRGCISSCKHGQWGDVSQAWPGGGFAGAMSVALSPNGAAGGQPAECTAAGRSRSASV